jgi:hypothetical protein
MAHVDTQLPPAASAPDEAPKKLPSLSWRKKLCFTLAVFGILLLAGEAGVRLFARLTNRERLYQLDGVAGYTCKPSLVRMTKRYGNHEFHYSTDERGFRITRPPGTERKGESVVLLGDSFTFGFCVDDEDSLGFLLSEETGRPVVSLSAAGYSPDIYLPLLREHLEHKNAPVGQVVLLVCDNDFTDLTNKYKNHRPKASFEREGDHYVERPPQITWLDRLMDYSDLAFKIYEVVLPAARQTNVPYEETPVLMCEIVKRIQELCDHHQVPLVAVLFEHLDKPQVSENLKNEFIDRCRAQGIRVDVITDQIRAGVDDFHKLLAVDNWHWSRMGNERVSRLIQERLKKRPA